VPRGSDWRERVDVDLDRVGPDSAAKDLGRMSRGTASEAYAPQRRSGLVCLPWSFFRNCITDKTKDGEVAIGNRARGWHDATYETGHLVTYDVGMNHGHGLFLRGMLSHALGHTHPDFFTTVRRASEVVQERPSHR
jgi:hypothetical protein